VERRLDELGRRQADSLADLLAGSPLVSVRSSPATRCIETVSPVADRHLLAVEVDAALLEGADFEDAWSTLAVAAGTDGDVVLCSHGDVIPNLLRRLQFRGMELSGGSGCAKGSCWTLDGWDGERFERGAYLPPQVRG